jgi:hypothetical protein
MRIFLIHQNYMPINRPLPHVSILSDFPVLSHSPYFCLQEFDLGIGVKYHRHIQQAHLFKSFCLVSYGENIFQDDTSSDQKLYKQISSQSSMLEDLGENFFFFKLSRKKGLQGRIFPTLNPDGRENRRTY